MHVHVYHADGEAKFWIEPEVALAKNTGLSDKQLNDIKTVIEDKKNEIEDSWRKHFNR